MIYEVDAWQDTQPHWHVAYVEADSAEQAKDRLEVRLGSPIDTVRTETIRPKQEWVAAQVATPFIFVLGAGCR